MEHSLGTLVHLTTHSSTSVLPRTKVDEFQKNAEESREESDTEAKHTHSYTSYTRTLKLHTAILDDDSFVYSSRNIINNSSTAQHNSIW